MGRLIFCIGNKAKEPYYFQSTGMKVYTMEELCYYLYHNIETLEEDLSERQLVQWIREELGIEERADFLQQLMDHNASIKDIIVSIFCTTDYYTEDEINNLIAEIDVYFELLPIERKKRHADAFLRYGKTREAMLEYQNLLDDKDFVIIPAEEQAKAFHNMAVLLAKNGMFKNAAKYFLNAYQKGAMKESLCQYLYSLKIGGMEEEFNAEIVRYSDETEVMHIIENQFYFLEENREYSPEYINVLRLIELKDKDDDTETDEDGGFWWLFEETVDRLKKEYRDT